MAAQISDHDALVERLRAHITSVQRVADLSYAAASEALNMGTHRDMERIGNKATDLVIALGSLRPD
jgi:hypothetical protein